MDAVDQRATRASIDLDQLAANVTRLSATLKPGTRVMAVVKANAYGHGAPYVARAALAAGAHALAVATVHEGQQLRSFGIQAPILVLSPIMPHEVSAALAANLDLTVGSSYLAQAVIDTVRVTGEPAQVHLKVDTGMHRGGCDPDAALDLARQLTGEPGVTVSGMMTHFHSADESDASPTHRQTELLVDVLSQFTQAGIDPGVVHAANSAAAIRFPEVHFHQVRIGIAMYGLAPSAHIPLPQGVRPILTLESRLQRIESLRAGEHVGYGGTYVAQGGERIGLVPIGYADGYRRGFSHLGWMASEGLRLPVLGRVSMDQTTVLLPPGSESLTLGDRVSIIGGDPASPSVDELAALAGTINYEIVTGLAIRLPRHYVQRGQVIAVTSI